MNVHLIVGLGVVCLVGCAAGTPPTDPVRSRDARRPAPRPDASVPRPDGSAATVPDAEVAPAEACDTFDDDEDGRVDEGCSCSAGATQACHLYAAAAPVECGGVGTQVCGGTGEFGGWGPCVVPPPTVDDLCPWWVLGASANDQLSLGRSGTLADVNGDGDFDIAATAVHGDGATEDVGSVIVLCGGPGREGVVTDLAMEPRTGSNGFVVADVRASGSGVVEAALADVDGDGLADVVTTGARAVHVVYGSAAPAALYTRGEPGQRALEGAAGSQSVASLYAFDFDSDGRADVFSSGNNSTFFGGTSDGLSVWWGGARGAATQARDVMVGIGIGTVGVATQSNFGHVSGAGDFDNDGHLDLTAMNGAANDGMTLPYVGHTFYGAPDRALPSSMSGVAAGGGFRVQGAAGRGVVPNHQHGDFDGDGIDDEVLNGAGNGYAGATAYVLYGGAAAPGATVDVGDGALAATRLRIPSGDTLDFNAVFGTSGIGDLDGDGYDDLVLSGTTDGDDAVVIVWGRPARAVADLDVATDATTTRIPVARLAARLGDRVRVDDSTIELAVGDVDGDGLGDIVAGLPRATAMGRATSGAGFVLFGHQLYALHNPTLRRSRAADDEITLVAGPARVAAGRGADRVTSSGNADVIYLGAGDDVATVAGALPRRLHGGLGADRLVLTDAGTLDLTTTGRAAILGFEELDLSAPAAQRVVLGAGDAAAMTGARRMRVTGDASDELVLRGVWSSAGAGSYTHGTITVEVIGALATGRVRVEP